MTGTPLQMLLTYLDAEKLGTAFSMVRSDISGNISRLQARQAQDPDRYALLFPIVLDEVDKGGDKGSSSATKGLLWLKRFVTGLTHDC